MEKLDIRKHDPWTWFWLALSLVLAGFFLANVIYYTKVKRQCTALKPGAVNSMIIINSVGLAVIIIGWLAFIIYNSVIISRARAETGLSQKKLSASAGVSEASIQIPVAPGQQAYEPARVVQQRRTPRPLPPLPTEPTVFYDAPDWS